MKKVVILIVAYFLSEAVGFTDIFYDLDQVSQIRKRQITSTLPPPRKPRPEDSSRVQGQPKPQEQPKTDVQPITTTTTTMKPKNINPKVTPTTLPPKHQSNPTTPPTTVGSMLHLSLK